MIKVERAKNHIGMDITVILNDKKRYFTIAAAKELRDKLDNAIQEHYAPKDAQ